MKKSKKILSAVLILAVIISSLIIPVSVNSLSSKEIDITDSLVWEMGGISPTNGSEYTNDYNIKTGYIKVNRYSQIVYNGANTSFKHNLYWYDKNKNFIEAETENYAMHSTTTDTYMVKSNYCYLRVQLNRSGNAITTDFASNLTSLVATQKDFNSSVSDVSLDWEVGRINPTTGGAINNSSFTDYLRTSDMIDVSSFNSLVFLFDNGNDSYEYTIFKYSNTGYLESTTITANGETTFNVGTTKRIKVQIHTNKGTSYEWTEYDYNNRLTVKANSSFSAKQIDSSKKGSITIYDYQIPDYADLSLHATGEEQDYSTYLTSIGATPLQGVTFKATRVVNDTFVNGKGKTFYSGTEDIELPDVSDVKTSIRNNDGEYSEFNTYTFSATNASGKAQLTNLPLGIYLIHEENAPSSVIEHIADYLVSVPMTNSSGTEWNYNIVTYPKTVNGVILTYDSNNGSGLSNSEPRRAGKTEPLTKNPFTTTGMIFLGWADEASATVPKYRDMQDFTMPEHDKTIYAVWGYTNSFRYYTTFKYSEPWGLQLSFAMLNPKTGRVIDHSLYSDYGIYIYAKHSKSDVVDFNWNEWEIGRINPNTGQNILNDGWNDYLRTKNFLDVSKIDKLTFKFNSHNSDYSYEIFKYSSNKSLIEKTTAVNTDGTTSLNVDCAYIKIDIQTTKGKEYEWNENTDGNLLKINANSTPTIEEVVTKGKKATEYSSNQYTFNDGNVDNYLTTIYDEDIYTRTLADEIFAVPYVTYKGRTFWGTVRNRTVKNSIDSIISSSAIGLTTYTEAEVRLATAIKYMYDKQLEYLDGSEPQTDFPKGKKIDSKDFSDGEIDNSFTFYTSTRAVDPWGLVLQGKPNNNEKVNYSQFSEYGVITYTDIHMNFSKNNDGSAKSLTYRDLINNNDSVVFSSKDETAGIFLPNGVNNEDMAMITAFNTGIYTYRLYQTDMYSCFYYVKDGEYHYSDVKKRRVFDIISTLAERKENNEFTLDAYVAQSMINLYRETYYYRNGKYPTDSYDGPIWYLPDN